MIAWLLSLINPLSRILSTIDNRVDNETERERIKAQTVEAYVAAQAQVLTGRGWWFPLFIIVPVAVWFGAVCLYSVFFCRSCAFPQDWTIAALPEPLNSWAGAIITSLCIGRAGESILAKWRR